MPAANMHTAMSSSFFFFKDIFFNFNNTPPFQGTISACIIILSKTPGKYKGYFQILNYVRSNTTIPAMAIAAPISLCQAKGAFSTPKRPHSSIP